MAEGDSLRQAKADATLLWIKAQEDAGLDIVGDGEQSRQHFVHGFLEQVEGIDFEHKVKMGIRDNRYDAMVPQVVSALRLKGRVHAFEAQLARAHTKKKLKFTLPGPMTIVDTVADSFYGDKVKMAFAFAELLNQEALALQAHGVDIIQFDEPAFNVYMKDAADWGVQALERAAQGLTCTTAVHICYGYGIKANTDWKSTLGEEWRQYEAVFPALAESSIDWLNPPCKAVEITPWPALQHPIAPQIRRRPFVIFFWHPNHAAQPLTFPLHRGHPGACTLRLVEGLLVQRRHPPPTLEPKRQVHGSRCSAAGLVALQGTQADAQVPSHLFLGLRLVVQQE